MRIKLKHSKWDVEPIDPKGLFIIYAISTNQKGEEIRTKHLNYANIKQVKRYLMEYDRCGVEEVTGLLGGLYD